MFFLFTNTFLITQTSPAYRFLAQLGDGLSDGVEVLLELVERLLRVVQVAAVGVHFIVEPMNLLLMVELKSRVQ